MIQGQTMTAGEIRAALEDVSDDRPIYIGEFRRGRLARAIRGMDTTRLTLRGPEILYIEPGEFVVATECITIDAEEGGAA